MVLLCLLLMMMMIDVYGHFCAQGRLNGPSDLQRYWDEVKDETTFRYAHARIRTRVVVICVFSYIIYCKKYILWVCKIEPKQKSVRFVPYSSTTYRYLFTWLKKWKIKFGQLGGIRVSKLVHLCGCWWIKPS